MEKTVTNNKMSLAPNECEKIEFEGMRNDFILYGETLENSNMADEAELRTKCNGRNAFQEKNLKNQIGKGCKSFFKIERAKQSNLTPTDVLSLHAMQNTCDENISKQHTVEKKNEFRYFFRKDKEIQLQNNLI